MPFVLTMPKLSPTMETGTLVKWHKKEGDRVDAGDLLFEVATDKATVEHTALDEGWIKKILVNEGQDATVNQSLAIMTEEQNQSIEGFKIPESTSFVREQTEASNEAVKEEKKDEPAKVRGGSIQQPSFVPEPSLENYQFEFPTDRQEKRIKASPLAKKLAKEKELDISTVKGSGPGGRIISRDLAKAQPLGKVNFGQRKTPQFAPGSYTEIPLNPMRKVIGQRLQESKTFVPHFYVTLSVNAEPLVNVREQLIAHQLKPTVNDFVIRACALALKDHPTINSGFNSVNQSIIQFNTIDIAIAVSVEGGLITPIIRYADYKNLGELSVEVKSLAQKAREGKLELQEYKGGSFTISNLGMFGVSEFQAIINPPQAAILAVSGIQEVPVIKNGSIVAGKTMNLTLSVDHRVIDGAAAAQFLQTLKKLLENPAILLI